MVKKNLPKLIPNISVTSMLAPPLNDQKVKLLFMRPISYRVQLLLVNFNTRNDNSTLVPMTFGQINIKSYRLKQNRDILTTLNGLLSNFS